MAWNFPVSRCWRVQLRCRGAIVEDRVVSEHATLTIGEGGQLVIPGIAGARALLERGGLRSPEGLEGSPSDTGVSLRVVAHPDIEIEVSREEIESMDFRRGLLRLPTRETLYGAALAVCLASLVAVDVAVSPARAAEPDQDPEDEQSMLVEEMLSVPMAHVAVPPPVVAVFEPPAVEPEASSPDPDNDVVTVAEIAPPDVLAEVPDPEEPPPRPRRSVPDKSKRIADRSEGAGVIEMLEVVSIDSGTELLGTSTLSGRLEDLSELEVALAEGETGMLVGMGKLEEPADVVSDALVEERESYAVHVDPAPSSEIPTEVPAPHIREPDEAEFGSVGRGVVGGVVVDVVRAPAGGTEEGSDQGQDAPDCEMEFHPKAQAEVVFVIDVTEGTGPTVDSLRAQIGALDAKAREHDPDPRYGLVLFSDRVVLDNGGPAFADRMTLDGALKRASDRVRDGADGDGPAKSGQWPRNGLDALYTAATAFAWGDADGTLRLVVYVSDGSLADGGEAVSEGHTVQHGYGETLEALRDAGIRVASFTPRKDPQGKSIGSGFWSGNKGRDALPQGTAGLAFRLSALTARGLAPSLSDLLKNPVCRKSALSGLLE